MRFCDSSEIIPLYVKERASDAVRKLMDDDGVMAVWWITCVECLSALSRRLREGMLTSDDERNAKKVLSVLMNASSEVQPTETVR